MKLEVNITKGRGARVEKGLLCIHLFVSASAAHDDALVTRGFHI